QYSLRLGTRSPLQLARAIETVVGGRVEHRRDDPRAPWVIAVVRHGIWRAVPADSAETGVEITAPCLVHALIRTLQRVVRALRSSGARTQGRGAVVVDASDLDPRARANVAKMIAKQAQLLARAFGAVAECVVGGERAAAERTISFGGQPATLH